MSAVRQHDQLPPDATTLARKVATLEREVKELRAARRLGSATVGDLRLYSKDGQTLLAELGRDTQGGGGLWTRGLQDPINMSAYLRSGELRFRPVPDGMVATAASISYDSDAFQYSDLVLTSGAVNDTDHRAMLILESLFDGSAHASFQGENSARCDVDVLGVMTASNIAYGTVAITPAAANTPTSANITGLNVAGNTFVGFASPVTTAPGTVVTGTSTINVTSTGLTVWLTRTTTATTSVNWMVIGV
jgi:hypothetical protein